jgi:hypothetical protein
MKSGLGAKAKASAPFLFAALLALTACTDVRVQSDRLAASNGWQRADFAAAPFLLRGYQRFDRPGADALTIYIESDGLSWIDRETLSSDPTPLDTTVLALATADPSPNRAYVGRPCQFLDDRARASCAPVYWASGRFAPEVVAAVDAAVTEAKRRSGASRLRLFGFSGGGAIAALVAARRGDVELLVTIAGTLDHARWTRDDGVSPLSRSLNPADAAERLQALRQIHFVGAKDEAVPPAVVESYLARMTDRSRATLVRIPNYGHECCWGEGWRGLLARYVYVPGRG